MSLPTQLTARSVVDHQSEILQAIPAVIVMNLMDGQAVKAEDGVVTLVLVVALFEEVFGAKAASWSQAQNHAFHVEIVHEVGSRASHISPRLKGDFVLDLFLLGGLRRLERVRNWWSRPFKASSRLLLTVSTIWRNSPTSSSRRLEAATLAEAGLDRSRRWRCWRRLRHRRVRMRIPDITSTSFFNPSTSRQSG